MGRNDQDSEPRREESTENLKHIQDHQISEETGMEFAADFNSQNAGFKDKEQSLKPNSMWNVPYDGSCKRKSGSWRKMG